MDSKFKIFKDPVYGYIKIPHSIVNDIIDTPEFQRLRRISQTSYFPVYPSSNHNRFCHSIGVYYLGVMVSNALLNSLKERYSDFYKKNKGDIDNLFNLFILACLLHDVGHAPFSHTLEDYFRTDDDWDKIDEDLSRAVGDQVFSKDIKIENFKFAKPHEIVSATIGLIKYSDLFKNSEEKSFFARCITGYLYSENDKITSLKNILIKMLNSDVFDVDKLDYLIRDSFTAGFQSVSIDYKRFLKSFVVYEEKNVFNYAITKSGISVLENIIYAHDYERKWIQCHPVVVYHSSLLVENISSLLNRLNINAKNLFNRKALTIEGEKIDDNITLRLLSDDDIMFLLKTKLSNDEINRLFSRSKSMKPLWKSEAEYNAIFKNSKIQVDLKVLEDIFLSMTRLLKEKDLGLKLDNSFYKKFSSEYDKILKQKNVNEARLKQYKMAKAGFDAFKEFAESNSMDFVFKFVKRDVFSSNFNRVNFGDFVIELTFGNKKSYFLFKELFNKLSQKNSDNIYYYYVFYNKATKEFRVDSLFKELVKHYLMELNEV